MAGCGGLLAQVVWGEAVPPQGARWAIQSAMGATGFYCIFGGICPGEAGAEGDDGGRRDLEAVRPPQGLRVMHGVQSHVFAPDERYLETSEINALNWLREKRMRFKVGLKGLELPRNRKKCEESAFCVLGVGAVEIHA